MDRRSFLRLFGAVAAGAVLDPERLLWVPGQKTIFLPSVSPVVPPSELNDFLTLEWVAQESLRLLKRELMITPQIYRRYAA